MSEKNHYRKVFKSNHLSSADLEDFIEEKKPLIFTIKEVKQELNVSVAGKKGNFNIAYFVENIKPLVLNSTNSKVLKSFSNGSPFVEDWKNIAVELYIDENVKLAGSVVSGIRIRQTQPKAKAKPVFTEANFEKAKAAGATIERIKQAYEVSNDVELKYNEYAKN